jgi:hypothetical protein
MYTRSRSGTARTFVNVRNLEGRFHVRVQHDLRVRKAGILRLHRPALRDVVGHKLRRDRHIHRIARLRQGRFIIAIDQVPHDEVPHQSRQRIGRHQFHDRVCYIC